MHGDAELGRGNTCDQGEQKVLCVLLSVQVGKLDNCSAAYSGTSSVPQDYVFLTHWSSVFLRFGSSYGEALIIYLTS